MATSKEISKKKEETDPTASETTRETEARKNLPNLEWDDSKMASSYANMCNVASSREEVMILFGMNQAWNNEQDKVIVELHNRIILNPLAAKRLLILLSRTLADYEKNIGKIG